MNHPQISDWPEDYVERVSETECWGLSDEDLLEALCENHEDMRFGRHIDLNIQCSFYLHHGNRVTDMPQGSNCGFVIGALSIPYVDIGANGDASWVAADAQDHYVTDGEAKLTWVLANSTGPWFLTADFHNGRGEDWYWLVLRFLNVSDEAAFVAAFRKDEA